MKFTRPAFLMAILSACVLASGCGGVGEKAAGLFRGSDSADKKEIPPTVAASSVVQSLSTLPGVLDEPVLRDKNPEVATPGAEEATDKDTQVREQVWRYRSSDRRDPFRALVGNNDKKSGVVDLALAKLVAVVEGAGGVFCVVEDADGMSHVLRKGDRVRNGRVVSVGSNSLIASRSVFGYTTTVRLGLVDRKDDQHE
ncbi:MAG: hypothetical protein QF819_03265 [Gemmatimonadota bacterium]|jgi:hypothetical protein|nr:hypothetical protein [Gemmatimonadota bacterium]MDP6529295.1 hypothetical protein [Gemmatimonadota bacterium]MDP6802180.1 hypothetical protein [Gemmatimonadota bacterium]MDP7031510.1 hypothetical protein [Gemmatimonadota bacterium]